MKDRINCFVSGLAIAWAIILLGLMVPACTQGSYSEKVMVVTTSNIVADWITQVGGDNVEVHSLLPAGADPHTFQPGAGDVALVAKAKIVFTIGLGLEGTWLNRLLENAVANPDRVKNLGDHVNPIKALEEETLEEQEEQEDHQHGIYDPHFWWDPLRVKMAVEGIAQQLSLADPDNTDIYSQNKTGYIDELDKLDTRIRQQIMQIPAERREIVTSHETMQYFSIRYGFHAIGSIFSGVTTEQEPSPAELANLTKRIVALGVPAIFTETTVNDRLARAIATETGARVVRLYSDSLGLPESGADTYIGMMDTDIELIVDALK